MPEAPEVQTVLDTLEKNIQDCAIQSVQVSWPKTVSGMTPEEFSKRLAGQHFRRFFRRGKYLVFELDDYDLVAHLRMEGKLYTEHCDKDGLEKAKHVHVQFSLNNGLNLFYQDIRKFGRMQLFEKREDWKNLPCFDRIGPDALDDDYPPQKFYQKLHRSKKPVKSLLLDQAVIAGIGNIYADEILFACGIHPDTPAEALSLEQAESILKNTREILLQALKAKGTTIRTFTSDQNHAGGFQQKLKVHTRADKPCPVCGAPVEKTKTGQRTSYFCPHCQPAYGKEGRENAPCQKEDILQIGKI